MMTDAIDDIELTTKKPTIVIFKYNVHNHSDVLLVCTRKWNESSFLSKFQIGKIILALKIQNE